jgi:hypothetical protein
MGTEEPEGARSDGLESGSVVIWLKDKDFFLGCHYTLFPTIAGAGTAKTVRELSK